MANEAPSRILFESYYSSIYRCNCVGYRCYCNGGLFERWRWKGTQTIYIVKFCQEFWWILSEKENFLCMTLLFTMPKTICSCYVLLPVSNKANSYTKRHAPSIIVSRLFHIRPDCFSLAHYFYELCVFDLSWLGGNLFSWDLIGILEPMVWSPVISHEI